jgi:putative transposase
VRIARKYRLYPSKEQQELLAQHFGCTRWVYNFGLHHKSSAWTDRKENITRFQLSAMLPGLKRAEETAWLSGVNSQSLQSAVNQLDAAYQCFFRISSRRSSKQESRCASI